MYFAWLRRIFKKNRRSGSGNKWKQKVFNKIVGLKKRGKGVDVVKEECDCVGETIEGTS